MVFMTNAKATMTADVTRNDELSKLLDLTPVVRVTVERAGYMPVAYNVTFSGNKPCVQIVRDYLGCKELYRSSRNSEQYDAVVSTASAALAKAA